MRYQARWEAHADAPRLTLGHCPYAAILPEHPELCALDAALLETLLGAPATQVAKLARDGRGGMYCLFVIAVSTAEERLKSQLHGSN
jgi:predicted ArsR family transcriptional regulator